MSSATALGPRQPWGHRAPVQGGDLLGCNQDAFDAFLRVLGPEAEDANLSGPFLVPGNEFVLSGIPVFAGKVSVPASD